MGFAVGVAALVAAVVAASSGVPLWERLADVRAPAWMWAVWLAAPLASLLLTTANFVVLTNARLATGARLSFLQMFELIGSSWLLNFLPLSPGLFGRIAYQKKRHGITVRDSVVVVVESILLSWLAAAVVVPIAYTADDPRWVMLAVFGLVGIWLVVFCRYFGRQSIASARVMTLILKLADQCVWSVKYYVVFRMMGLEPTLAEACLIAAVAQSAMLVPFIGNGLGVREWMVALVAAGLPAWFRTEPGTGPVIADGLSADLLSRAGEIAVAIPAGLCCIGLLSRRLKGLSAAEPTKNGGAG